MNKRPYSNFLLTALRIAVRKAFFRVKKYLESVLKKKRASRKSQLVFLAQKSVKTF